MSQEDNKVTIELTPFTALAIMTLASIFEKKIPEGKIRQCIEDYRMEVTEKMSMEDIDDAFIEKEI